MSEASEQAKRVARGHFRNRTTKKCACGADAPAPEGHLTHVAAKAIEVATAAAASEVQALAQRWRHIAAAAGQPASTRPLARMMASELDTLAGRLDKRELRVEHLL